MSLMSMRRKMASKRTAAYILWILIVIFVLGVVLMSIPKDKLGPTDDIRVEGGHKPFALVGDGPITLDAMELAYGEWRRTEGQSATFTEILDQRRRIFNGLVDDALVTQEMKSLGIRDHAGLYRKYAEEEAASALDQLRDVAKSQAETQKTAAKTDEEKAKVKSEQQVLEEMLGYYMSMLGGQPAQQVTERDFARWYAREYLLNRESPDAGFLKRARLRVIGAKIIATLPVNPLTEDFIKKLSTQEVKARWLFIAVKDKGAEAQAEARKRAEALRAEIVKAPESFAEKAKADSAHITAPQGGDLGWIKAGENPFLPLRAEYLAFSLKPGEISPVVQCVNLSFSAPSGVEVGYGFLLVEEVRTRETAKEDGYKWEKERAEAMPAATQRYEGGFGQDAVELRRAQSEVRGVMPEARLYLAEQAGDGGEGRALKAKIVTGGKDERAVYHDVRAAFAFTLAQETEDPPLRVQYLLQAVEGAGSSLAQVRLELGRAYLANDQQAQGVEQFTMAETAGKVSDVQLREDLKAEYEKLGDAEAVKRMDDWLAANKTAAPTEPVLAPQ